MLLWLRVGRLLVGLLQKLTLGLLDLVMGCWEVVLLAPMLKSKTFLALYDHTSLIIH